MSGFTSTFLYEEVTGPLTLSNSGLASPQPTGPWTSLSGPSITVDVPNDAVARISAYAEITNRPINPTTGNPMGDGFAQVIEATDFPNGLTVPDLSSWPPFAAAPFGPLAFLPDNVANGAGFIGPFEYMPTPGTRTYVLQFQEFGTSGSSVDFQNCKLWLELVAPA